MVLLTWGFTPRASQLPPGAGGWPGQAGMGSFSLTLELLFLAIKDRASQGAGPSSDAGGKSKSVVLRLRRAGNGAVKNPAVPTAGVTLTKPESKKRQKIAKNLWKLPGRAKPAEEKRATFHAWLWCEDPALREMFAVELLIKPAEQIPSH